MPPKLSGVRWISEKSEHVFVPTKNNLSSCVRGLSIAPPVPITNRPCFAPILFISESDERVFAFPPERR
jgi:hypothetical protein